MSTVYAPDVITFKFASIDVAVGLGEGDFLDIAKAADDWTTTVGIGGDVVFNKIPGGVTIIKATLLQTSSANILLTAYHLASRLIEGGGPAPLLYEDRLGTSKGIDTAAVIQKMADEKFGKEAKDVTWAFISAGLARIVGGH
jgi:hypothetical protein